MNLRDWQKALGRAAQAIVEQIIYDKMPTHLRKSVNSVHHKNGVHENFVIRFQNKLQLKSLEADSELQMIRLRQ